MRTLMYLASVPGRATVDRVAEVFGISANHVAKGVNLLSRLGYVRSVRGIGGGIELARDPASMKLGDLIVALEGNLHLLDCVGQENVCAIESFCKLKGVLAEAERTQQEFLNGYSIADVAPRSKQLKSLIS